MNGIGNMKIRHNENFSPAIFKHQHVNIKYAALPDSASNTISILHTKGVSSSLTKDLPVSVQFFFKSIFRELGTKPPTHVSPGSLRYLERKQNEQCHTNRKLSIFTVKVTKFQTNIYILFCLNFVFYVSNTWECGKISGVGFYRRARASGEWGILCVLISGGCFIFALFITH